MRSVSIPYRCMQRIACVLLTLAFTISVLFCSVGVWAEALETEKIAFVSKRDGNAEIYIMNPDGTEQVNLTQHPAEDYDPAWFPDGKQILFSSNRAGRFFDLYLMDADGGNVQTWGFSTFRHAPEKRSNQRNCLGQPRRSGLHRATKSRSPNLMRLDLMNKDLSGFGKARYTPQILMARDCDR